jgi:hypothetical protein
VKLPVFFFSWGFSSGILAPDWMNLRLISLVREI